MFFAIRFDLLQLRRRSYVSKIHISFLWVRPTDIWTIYLLLISTYTLDINSLDIVWGIIGKSERFFADFFDRLKTALCPKSPTHPCWQKTFHYNRLQMPSMKEDFQETNTVIQSFNIEIRLIPTLFWSFWHWNSKLTFPKRLRLGWWQRRVQSASPRNWLPAFSFRNDFRQIK